MNETNNMFKRGLDQSMIMGLYTTIISLATLYSDMVPPLAIISLIMIAAGPALLYWMQRRTWLQTGGSCTMWDLWRMGVVAIFFGTLLTAMITYGVLEFLRPGFLYAQIESQLEVFKQIPELKNGEMAQTLQILLDEDLVPSPFTYVLNMWSVTNCTGMFMGMLTAMLASRGGINRM